ncbi:MAG: insulinase family protein [Bacteroidetes bacterium]|nr:insulinase family protein [Bacteroidota bacterium]
MRLSSRMGMLVLLLMCALPAMLSAQEKEIDASSLGLGSALPLNPAVRMGKLDNGMVYYIMQNKKPENRAALRLAVNAGSVLETDEQQGLAHFVEHMCFNGTENFEKNELIKYLESLGIRFGADLNAYTSFDETVYMLELPMDDEEAVTKGMQVLVDWASAVSFDGEEIDKERGVIIEEWRSRNGAGARLRDKQFPILLNNSKYAERLPIGKVDILKTFEHETIRAFYREWYRPDLMAIAAVGDFDMDKMEAKIREMFGSIPKRDTPVQRPTYEVPDHDELLFAIATDKEATGTSLSLYHKMKPTVDRKVMEYRKSMMEQLYSTMLNDRYDELTQKKNPPFIGAYSGKGGFVRAKDVYVLGMQTKDDGVLRGFEALLVESKRVKDHGFTASELERAKTNVLSRMEQSYNEREKTPSDRHASEFVRNFLTEEPIPGIEIEYELYKKYLPTISIREINKLTADFMSEKNRVVTLSMPEKDGLAVPTEAKLRAVMDKVDGMTLEAYVDEVANKPLAQIPASKVAIETENIIGGLDVIDWKLSNGIRVLLKTTDFKADEVRFAAVSPGGNGTVSDADIASGAMAATIIDLGGAGEFDAVQLKKQLAGKVLNVSPFIGGEYEGFSGSAAPKDLETAMQLVYLYFTNPRKDTTAFEAFKTRMSAMFENFGNMPERVFSDTLQVTLANYHPRVRPVTKEWLESVDLEKAFDIYSDRFADAGDFTFIFVGNITAEQLRPLVEKYLGALPVKGRKETWTDPGVRPPKGVVKKEVYKGVDDKSMVAVVFHGDFDWTYDNRYILSSLRELLNIKLREAIREDAGGTYGVGVRASSDRYPVSDYTLYVTFGTDPARVEELRGTLFEVLEDTKKNLSTEENLQKIKEIQRRERETSMKENGFWLGRMQASLTNNDPLDEWLDYQSKIDGLTLEALRAAAQQYIDFDNYVQVVLYPDKETDSAEGK